MTSLKQIHEQFDTQDKCMAFLVQMRWPEGVCCVRCGNPRVYKLKRPWCWQCKVCHKNGYRFSALVGTIFENTNYPLPIWFEVIYLICQSKKGMSALQIQRMLRENGRPTAYKTAFFICHRVRAMLNNPDFQPLMGVIEVDETLVGGKAENMHLEKRRRLKLAGSKGKTTVIGAIARKGNVVCQVIENTDLPTLDRFVRKVVNKEKVELIATDEHGGYHLLGSGPDALPHQVVRHSAGEYVRGIVHTNTIESFWSLLKRGVVGTYHNVSKKYLPLYLNEFSWRFNHRKDPDIFRSAMAGC